MANAIKPGDRVQCPPDMGQPGYSGTVQSIGPGSFVNIHGAPYQWATVKRDGQACTVWPTNRIKRI